MTIFKNFKYRKIFLLNVFITLYVLINLVGGERGLSSYYDKKKLESKLTSELSTLEKKFQEIENKNKLLSENLDLDYLDILYREKFKFSKQNEILIKLK
tara:strand:+ start:189 stop:485 length:297 start_codon:yes stop_codon:yes gene_type:complete